MIADRYRIERFIAAGGMGEVYEAHDTALDQRIALKTIKPDVAQHGPAIERFLREIALARKVTHPNVCRIFELGYLDEADELPFLTMELLHGEPLHAQLVTQTPALQTWPSPQARVMQGSTQRPARHSCSNGQTTPPQGSTHSPAKHSSPTGQSTFMQSGSTQ